MNPSGDAQPSAQAAPEAHPRPAPQRRVSARGQPGPQGLPSWARGRAIVAARGEGDTLAEIGARFGLTRERVRQILVAEGGGTQTAASQRARAERQWAAAVQRRNELLALFRAGLGDQAIAQHLGIKRQTVSALIAACADAGDKDARRRAQQAASDHAAICDQALLGAVRQASQRAGQVPTSTQYAQIARAEGLPSLSTLANRFDGWNGAVRAAGLTPAHPHNRTYHRRWTEQACLEALSALVAELGEMPTQARYDQLVTQRAGLPSLATVHNRLGRWGAIHQRLDKERGERGVERPAVGASVAGPPERMLTLSKNGVSA